MQVGTEYERHTTSTSPFDNLERLASTISAREHGNTSTYAAQIENQQRTRRYQHMHSQAMGTFARADLMLNKLRDRR